MGLLYSWDYVLATLILQVTPKPYLVLFFHFLFLIWHLKPSRSLNNFGIASPFHGRHNRETLILFPIATVTHRIGGTIIRQTMKTPLHTKRRRRRRCCHRGSIVREKIFPQAAKPSTVAHSIERASERTKSAPVFVNITQVCFVPARQSCSRRDLRVP